MEPVDEANGRSHSQKPMAIGTFGRIGKDLTSRESERIDPSYNL